MAKTCYVTSTSPTSVRVDSAKTLTLNYLDNTEVKNRTIKEFESILVDAKLVNRYKNSLSVNKSSGAVTLSDQIDGIKSLNAFIRRSYNLDQDVIIVGEPLLPKRLREGDYMALRNNKSKNIPEDKTAFVSISEEAFSRIQELSNHAIRLNIEAEEKLRQDLESNQIFESIEDRRYINDIKTYHKLLQSAMSSPEELIQSEMALRNNNSEKQVFSTLGKNTNPKSLAGQVEKLSKAFREQGVKVDIEYDETLEDLGEIRPSTKPGVTATIVLNPIKMQDDSVYHEFGHLLIDLIGYNSPIIQAAVSQLKNTELYDIVKSKYADEIGDDEVRLMKEVIATAIGIEGAKIETKNPSKFQIFLNKFFRAIGKIFGVSPSAAAQLAEKLFSGEINKSEFKGKLSDYTQKSKSLSKLETALQNAKYSLEQNIAISRRDTSPQANRNTRLLQYYKDKLNTVNQVMDFVEFVDYISNLVTQIESDFDYVSSRFNPNITTDEKLELINTLGNISFYLKSYYDSRNKTGVMNDIAKAVREETDALKRKPGVTQTELDNIAILDDKLVKLNSRMNNVFDDYLEKGLPMQASLMLDYHKGYELINAQLESLAANLERNEDSRYLIIDEEVIRARQDYKNKVITKKELKKLESEIAAKQVRAKKLGYTELIQQLKEAQLDKSAYSALFDPLIYSSQTGLQMFVTEVKSALLEAANETQDTKADLVDSYKKFLSNKSGLNPTSAYKNMYETVTYFINDFDYTGKPIVKEVNVLSFVQEFDVTRYYKNLRQMLTDAAKQYQKPDPSDQVALEEWKTSKDPKFVSLRSGYYQTIDDWHAKNSKESANARQRLRDLRVERKSTEREYLQFQNSNPERAAYAKIALDHIDQEIRFIYNEYNDTFRGDAVQPNDSYKNPKYETLKKSSDFEYYEKLLNIYHEKQGKLGKTNQLKNSWDNFSNIISVRGDTLGQMQSSGFMEASKDLIKSAFTVLDGETEFGELTNDSNGRMVPVFFTSVMDSKVATRDLTGAVIQFSRMADLFEAKSKIHASVILMRDVIEARKVIKTGAIAGVPIVGNMARRLNMVKYETLPGSDSKNLKHLEDFIESVFYGKTVKSLNVPIGNKIWNVNKTTQSLASLTALKVLSLNYMQGTNQFLLDNQKLLEEAATGQFINLKNRTWATAKFWGSGFGVSDLGAFSPKSKLVKAALWADAYNEELNSLENDKFNSRTRQVLSSPLKIGSVFQSAAEHQAVLIRMLALMDNYRGKLKDSNGDVLKNSNGEDANLYDMLIEKPNGRLVLDPRVANLTQMEFINKLAALVKKTNQLKGTIDRSSIEREWYGGLITLFRRFFPPGLRRRYGYGANRGVHVDTESGFIGGGMYGAFVNYISRSFSKGLKFRGQFNALEDFEKRNVIRTFNELGWAVTTAVLGGMLYSDDDDDKARNFFAYQAIRMNAELTQFWSYSDFKRIIQSPTATMNITDGMVSILIQALRYDLPYELGMDVDKKDVFYQKATSDARKGDRKLKILLKKNTPAVTGWNRGEKGKEAISWLEQAGK